MLQNTYKSSKIVSSILWGATFLFLLFISPSCKKEWLDAKPIKSLAIPKTIRDYQALLSSTYTSDPAFNNYYGMFGEIASDNFYVTDNDFKATFISIPERNAYKWTPDLWGGTTAYGEWTYAYRQVYYTNIALDGIEKITPKNNPEQVAWNNVKGTALFFRAFGHYDIARHFCKPYIENTAVTDLGIPLRLQPDFNEVSVRSTVKQTYDQIISDLEQSASLISIPTPISNAYRFQPNQAAVYAMLGRVYLAMSDYDKAFLYADKSLQLYSALYNYNSLAPIQLSTPSQTFLRYLPEVLFYKRGIQWGMTLNIVSIPNPDLYNLYDTNDIRRKAFFGQPATGNRRCKESYDGSANFKFTGLATDEVYLIRAECHARLNRKDEALNDLNTLLEKRWKTGTFSPVTATDANDALRKVLVERRKELIFRSLRWEDLRRLNQDPQFAITLTKVVDGHTYNLPPNSNLYVFPIPDEVIRLTGMDQNPR